MKEKIIRQKDPTFVAYDPDRIELFLRMRREAKQVQERINSRSFVYGSLARGDVHAKSDIDIIVLDGIDPNMIELELDIDTEVVEREIIQATPNAVPKAHIHLNHYTTVSFPLLPLSKKEEEFYRFSGMYENIELERRIPGVNKKLLLIEPVERGHFESSIIGKELEVTRKLGIGIDIVSERIRVLTKRNDHGRTGVFFHEGLLPEESFTEKLRYISDRNRIVRRQIKERGS